MFKLKDIITNTELKTKIKNYPQNKFIVSDNLTKLKAIDAVKDAIPSHIAQQCFGLSNISLNSDALKEYIKGLFEIKVSNKEMLKIPYSRIKDRGEGDDYLQDVTYDYYIPDCGPKYSKGNGKTPVVKTAGGGEPIALYSLGNILDTGPSSSHNINLKYGNSYTIDNNIMTTLGYPGCSMTNINDNSFEFNLNIDSEVLDKDTFLKWAIGNTKKKQIIKSLNKQEQKKIVFIKSLGDTLIVYYWLWACKSQSKSIALLTCDSVVAFQADILCERNGHFLWNYNEKDEKKISYVYYKGAAPDYRTLFATEKRVILIRYGQEIKKFENNNVTFSFTGADDTYNNPDFIELIKTRLIAIKQNIEGMNFNGEESYKNLKKFVLIPIVNSIKRGTLILTRSKKGFYVSDREFIGIRNKSLHESFLVIQSYETYQRGGRNNTDLYNDWLRNINSEHVQQVEPFYYQPYEENVFGTFPISNTVSSDELAINILRRDVNRIFRQEIKGLDILYSSEFIRLADIEDRTNETEFGSVYDFLTYIFHYEPDYTTQTITKLIREFIDNYKIIPPTKGKSNVSKVKSKKSMRSTKHRFSRKSTSILKMLTKIKKTLKNRYNNKSSSSSQIEQPQQRRSIDMLI